MEYIYMKPKKKVTIVGKKEVKVKDVAKLEGEDSLIREIYDMNLMIIKEDKKKTYLLSAIDIVACIQQKYRDIIIYNYGETDIIISYLKILKKENSLLTFLKIAFVSMTLVTGGAIAIMTFHTDAAVPDVFKTLYEVFAGDTSMQPYIIEIPYSIGLAFGIIVFFNHFSKISITDDPTPIEVEMRLYEMDVENSIIESLKNEQEE